LEINGSPPRLRPWFRSALGFSRKGGPPLTRWARLASEFDRLYKALGGRDDDALVFPDRITGGPVDKAANLRRYRKVLKAATLDGAHNLHGLRHTFGIRMAAAGVPMRQGRVLSESDSSSDDASDAI
jgi:integrase